MYLKAELFQRTGSFKPRGVLNKLASLSEEEKARGIVTWSAGNAAQGAAFAAAEAGIPCTVVMWATANPIKVAATRGYGAEVDLDRRAIRSRRTSACSHTSRRPGGRSSIPFDDPVLQAGQGTLGLEIVEDVPDVETIVVPVGGGGLDRGRRIGRRTAASSASSRRARRRSPPRSRRASPCASSPRSIADGLNAPFTGQSTLDVCRERVDEVVLVTEDEIEDGMRFLYARAKLACEPAGAAAVAAVLAGKVALEADPRSAVVSGGNADPKIAAGILASR